MMANEHIPPRRDNNPTDIKDGTGRVTHKAHSFKDRDNNTVVIVEAPVGYVPSAEAWKPEWDTQPNAPRIKIINLVLRDGNGKAVTGLGGAAFRLRVKKLNKYAKIKYYNLDLGQWVELTPSNDEFVLESTTWWTDPPVGGDPF
jgi:hypothetical protein